MLVVGDCRDILSRWAAEGVRVQTVVTSPPYWGLRDYGVAGQLGLEATPEAYVARMVDVFRLVRDVLADDGTCWLNLGDSYATGAGKVGERPGGGAQGDNWQGAMTSPNRMPIPGLKPKDLVGIPWRVVFALQADGWYLRSDIIWAKPNPMPESVTDRPTKAHEYLFLLAKSERYYYDAAAIREPATYAGPNAPNAIVSPYGQGFTRRAMDARIRTERVRDYDDAASRFGSDVSASRTKAGNAFGNGLARNRRSVWTIATQPYREAHFATMPEDLVKPCILAGSRPGDTVLDPFMGSGTVAKVAQDLGRAWLGCELNPQYAELCRARTRQEGLVL